MPLSSGVILSHVWWPTESAQVDTWSGAPTAPAEPWVTQPPAALRSRFDRC